MAGFDNDVMYADNVNFSGVTPITPQMVADGQLIIGADGGNPQISTLTEGEGIDITNAAGSITVLGEDASTTNKGIVELATDLETQEGIETDKVVVPSSLNALMTDSIFTGFQSWGGAGSYYTVAGTNFTVDRPGTGYIKSKLISWLGAQTVSSLSQGNTHFVYIDNTGTIGSTAIWADTLYRDNIVLFEVLVDNDAPANLLVVKENHPYSYSTEQSLYEHRSVGPVIADFNGGANITLSGAAGIGISGTDFLEDHGLETTIPDSSGAAENWNFMFTDAGGKWVLDSTANVFPSVYNNAGVVTALGANRYGVFRLYASKDDIETTTPMYFAVIHTAEFNSQVLATAAIANNQIDVATNELFNLELAQLGYVVYEQSSSTIVSVIIEKGVIRGNTITSGTNVAALVTTDTANFDGWLSVVDTTVQQALETLDDQSKGTTFTGTVNAPTFDTNVAAAAVTLSGTTLAADGTDGNIDIDLTPKGNGSLDCNTFTIEQMMTATGSNVTYNIENLDNTNIVSHARVNIISGGASGGDPYIRFLVNDAQDYSLGIDNTDSDKLKITDSDTPSTGTDLFILDASGNLTVNGNIDAPGISFDGGTNTLANYATGTWTPDLQFGGGTTGITYILRTGTYTRIGDVVTVFCSIVLSNKGSSVGNAVVENLPFTVNGSATVCAGSWSLIDLTANYTSVSCSFFNAGTAVILDEMGDNVAFLSLTNASFANQSQIFFQGSYKI